ncbi:MAG: 3D domain-containing protein [Verrucomicrobiales bacterium]
MKKAVISSLLAALGFLVTSCSSSDSMAGIQDGKVKVATSQTLARSGSSAGGISLPANVDAVALSKASTLPRDKHGMPTYSHTERTRVVRTTAYSHMEMEPGAPGRKNALGTILSYGQVRSAAADWSVYPVGTRFKIKGLPYTYVVDDFGSALVGTNTIDIFHPSLSLMNAWGTRKAEITVIQWGSMERTANILSKRLKYPHTRRMFYAAQSKLKSGQVASN